MNESSKQIKEKCNEITKKNCGCGCLGFDEKNENPESSKTELNNTKKIYQL